MPTHQRQFQPICKRCNACNLIYGYYSVNQPIPASTVCEDCRIRLQRQNLTDRIVHSFATILVGCTVVLGMLWLGTVIK